MANNETSIDTEEVIEEVKEMTEKTDIKINVEVDKKKMEESTKTLEDAFSGLKKKIDTISAGIKKAMSSVVSSAKSSLGDVGKLITDSFAVTSLEEFETAAERFGEGLAGSLFSLHENMETLENSIVDAVAPIASVAVPVINDAVLAVTDLVSGVGQVIGTVFGGAAATDALVQSAAAAGDAAQQVNILPNTVDDPLTPQLQEITDKVQSLIEPLAAIDLTPAVTAFGGLQSSLVPLTQELFAGLEWAYLNLLVPLAEWSTEGLLPGFLDLVSGAMGVMNEVITALQPLAIWLWDSFLQPIAEWTGGVIGDVLQLLADKLGLISTWISENQALVESIAIVIGSVAAAIALVNTVTEIWTVVCAASVYISSAFGTAMATINWPVVAITAAIAALIAIVVLLVKNWDTISAKAKEVWDFVKTKFEEFNLFLQGVFAKDWTEQFGAFGNVLNAFFANVENIWNAVKSIFSGIVSFVKNIFAGDWSAAWDSIVSVFKGIWDYMLAVVKVPVNGIIGLINGLVEGVVGGINLVIKALNNISFDIPSWVPVIGGETFGFNLTTLTAPKIPHLAQGAVLPANRPFLAMVGDQRHGTNVEAPLTTIQEAVAVVLSQQLPALMAGFEAVVNEQRATREMIAQIQIGDDMIANAVHRFDRKMAVMRGL